MEEKRRSAIDNVIRYITIFMILLVTVMVVISMIKGKYDITGITIGIIFIFFLIVLKWTIKEVGID